MSEEREIHKTRGVITACNPYKSKTSGRDGFIITVKEDLNGFKDIYYWKNEGLNKGDIIEFEYSVSELNFKKYYTVVNVIDLKPIKPIDKETLKLPSDEMILTNDIANREIILIKCAFDYGNRKNMEYNEILLVWKQLRDEFNVRIGGEHDKIKNN